jgi:hypothetical protein
MKKLYGYLHNTAGKEIEATLPRLKEVSKIICFLVNLMFQYEIPFSFFVFWHHASISMAIGSNSFCQLHFDLFVLWYSD